MLLCYTWLEKNGLNILNGCWYLLIHWANKWFC